MLAQVITAGSSIVRAVCGGVTVCHTMGITKRVEENCSNVGDSLSTNNKPELKSDDKLLDRKVGLDWY